MDDFVDVDRAAVFRGSVFTDGSAVVGAAPELSRAAWAVAVVADGVVTAVAAAPVYRPLPQTSQAAEWCALVAAAQALTGPATIYADCQAVVDGCRGGGNGPLPGRFARPRHGALARQG